MKKLFNFRLPLILTFSIIMGISISYFIYFKNVFCIALVLSVFLLSIILYLILCRKNFRTALFFSLTFILIFIIGFGVFTFQINAYEKAGYGNHFLTVEAKITDVKPTGNGEKVVLSNVVFNEEHSTNYNILLNVSGKSNVKVGHTVRFYALIKYSSLIYENRIYTNNLVRGIRYTASVGVEELAITGYSPSIFEKANLFIKQSLESGLNGDEFSVAYALLTGNSEFVDEDVLTVFRNTGVAHIFAVSGLHIGFLAFILDYIFTKIKTKRLLRALIIIPILFFYSGVCSFSASSIRATIMSSVMLVISALGERYDGVSSLSIACFIILLFSPLHLFCVGFQLSFTVVFGIMLLSPIIKKIFRFLGNRLSTAIATVLSAQIFGFPICLYYFGEVSLISIIVNLLFVPLVGVLFISLLIFTIIGGIFGISNVLLFPLDYLIKGLIFSIKFFDNNILTIKGFTFGEFAILYYGLFILISRLINLKIKIKTAISLSLCVVIIVGVTVRQNDLNNPHFYVSGSEKVCFTLFASKEEKILILSEFERSSLYRLERVKIAENFDDIDLVVLQNYKNDIDVCDIVGQLNSLFKVKKYLYFGERNEMKELIVTKSFAGIEVGNYGDGTIGFKSNHFEISSVLSGKCICVYEKYSKKVVSVCTDLGSYGIIRPEFNLRCDILIACGNLEYITAHINEKQVISYLYNGSIENAQSQGNLKYYLTT